MNFYMAALRLLVSRGGRSRTVLWNQIWGRGQLAMDAPQPAQAFVGRIVLKWEPKRAALSGGGFSSDTDASLSLLHYIVQLQPPGLIDCNKSMLSSSAVLTFEL